MAQRYYQDADNCGCTHCDCAPGGDCEARGCSCGVCACPDSSSLCACALGNPCTLTEEQAHDTAILRALREEECIDA